MSHVLVYIHRESWTHNAAIVSRSMHACIYVWMYLWMDGCMYVWMHVWWSAWIWGWLFLHEAVSVSLWCKGRPRDESEKTTSPISPCDTSLVHLSPPPHPLHYSATGPNARNRPGGTSWESCPVDPAPSITSPCREPLGRPVLVFSARRFFVRGRLEQPQFARGGGFLIRSLLGREMHGYSSTLVPALSPRFVEC